MFDRYTILIISSMLLVGCGSQSIRYTPPVDVEVKDSGPKQPLDVAHIPDALPVKEPRTKAGNKNPYTVLGKTYYLIDDTRGFKQKGHASWYGKKFHGRKTSNGEVYDMYGMTAAHKTLPIPTFLKVTNTDNGLSVVVRVNDRGPFHGDRIIDLTYTAAKKLGFASKGTAPVLIEAIEASDKSFYQGLKNPTGTAGNSTQQAPQPKNSGGYSIPPGTFLQVGAFSDRARADAFRETIQKLSTYPVVLEPVPSRGIYRVILGPLKDNWDLVHLQQSLVAKGHQEPKILYR